MKYKISAEIKVPLEQINKLNVPTFGHRFVTKGLQTLKTTWGIRLTNIKIKNSGQRKLNRGKT